MRALAHPTRLALLDHLHAVDQATATECAAVIGESPSALSYHLRALARWRFVEEGEGGVGRERPWRATATRIEFPDGTLEAAVLRDELVARAHASIREALDEHVPPRWRRAAQTSFATLELRPSQLEELGERFEALLDEYRGQARRGTRRVVVSFQAVPRA
ncbi:MAG TPA: helix-turn-helix domain-containing protein [Gaiellaceae bacterium]